MHIASVILSLALGLISGAKIGMNEKTDFSNPNINLNDDFNLPFGSLEETRQGELDPCADMDYFNFTSAKRIKTYYNYDVNMTERQCRKAGYTPCGGTADDLITADWYRFTGAAGTMLATQPVERWHCGTYRSGSLKPTSNIWGDYEGTNPTTLGQEVKATVCFPGYSWFHYRSCYSQTEIKIKKCLGYFIYNLPTVPCCYGYCGQ